MSTTESAQGETFQIFRGIYKESVKLFAVLTRQIIFYHKGRADLGACIFVVFIKL